VKGGYRNSFPFFLVGWVQVTFFVKQNDFSNNVSQVWVRFVLKAV